MLQNILPARMAIFTLLALALLVALFVGRTRLPRLAVAAIVAVVCVPLLPDLPFLSQPAASPRFFEQGAKEIPEGSVAVVAPLAGLAAATARPMLWQVAADFRFKMPGGYVISDRRAHFVLIDRLNELLSGSTPPPPFGRELRDLRCDLVHLHTRTVIVGPMMVGRRRIVELFSTLLDRPPENAGGVQIWRDVSAITGRYAAGCA